MHGATDVHFVLFWHSHQPFSTPSNVDPPSIFSLIIRSSRVSSLDVCRSATPFFYIKNPTLRLKTVINMHNTLLALVPRNHLILSISLHIFFFFPRRYFIILPKKAILFFVNTDGFSVRSRMLEPSSNSMLVTYIIDFVSILLVNSVINPSFIFL